MFCELPVQLSLVPQRYEHHARLRATESDLASLNIGPQAAYHRAQNRRARGVLVEMVTSVIEKPQAYWLFEQAFKVTDCKL